MQCDQGRFICAYWAFSRQILCAQDPKIGKKGMIFMDILMPDAIVNE